jgi:hypothetical protein
LGWEANFHLCLGRLAEELTHNMKQLLFIMQNSTSINVLEIKIEEALCLATPKKLFKLFRLL